MRWLVLSTLLVATAVPSAVLAQSRTFPDELPEDATSGPHFDPARARGPGGITLPRPDPSDPSLPVALSVHIGVGYAMPSSIDRALATHLYADQDGGVMMTGDFQLTYRALDWLWLGGRFGFRGRGWGRNGDAGAEAGGFDLLGIVHVRGQLGRIFELGAMLGGGGGIAGLSLNGQTTVGASPRLTVSAEIAFRLTTGVRLQIRATWDYFPWFDLDRFGHDLDLGGPSVAAGFEVRT